MVAMSSFPRLFVDSPLIEGEKSALSDNQSNYVLRVMRLSEGDPVRVFNGRDGEWVASLVQESGKRASIVPDRKTRPQVETPDLTLFFAPLKKTRTDFVVEKACELGVRKIQPVMTERTQSSRVRRDRLQSVVIEAAEQTERMDVPEVFDDVSLQAALEAWPSDQPLYYCDEAGDARPMRDVLGDAAQGPAGILTGPEGGFSPRERDWIRKLPNIQPVTLGPRILRAETAVVAALTLWQSCVGDWQEHPYLPETANG